MLVCLALIGISCNRTCKLQCSVADRTGNVGCPAIKARRLAHQSPDTAGCCRRRGGDRRRGPALVGGVRAPARKRPLPRHVSPAGRPGARCIITAWGRDGSTGRKHSSDDGQACSTDHLPHRKHATCSRKRLAITHHNLLYSPRGLTLISTPDLQSTLTVPLNGRNRAPWRSACLRRRRRTLTRRSPTVSACASPPFHPGAQPRAAAAILLRLQARPKSANATYGCSFNSQHRRMLAVYNDPCAGYRYCE